MKTVVVPSSRRGIRTAVLALLACCAGGVLLLKLLGAVEDGLSNTETR